MASDEKEQPTGVSQATELEDCPGSKLDTIREVNRALAAALRLIKAGHLGHQRGAVLVNGYATLLKSLQDARDSKWLPRVREMWREREAVKTGGQASPH